MKVSAFILCVVDDKIRFVSCIFVEMYRPLMIQIRFDFFLTYILRFLEHDKSDEITSQAVWCHYHLKPPAQHW